MGLQLANGKIKYPLGMIDNVQVKICGIEFKQTFAFINFEQDTNYEVILGWPFM